MMIVPSYEDYRAIQSRVRRHHEAKQVAQDRAGLNSPMQANAARRGYTAFNKKDVVSGKIRGFQCLNPACLAVFYVAAGEEIVGCRACGTERMQYGVIEGRMNDTPCNAVCTHATGLDCDCSCGGANHAANWLVGFTFPRNIEKFRAEMAERKKNREAISEAYDTEDFAALLEQHNAAEEYFQNLADDAIEAEEERCAAVIASILNGTEPDRILTKAGKPAADQYFEGTVTSVKIMDAFNPFGEMYDDIHHLGLTCVDKNGARFWCKLNCGEGLIREEDGGRVLNPLVKKGDFVRVKARVKSSGDDIRFLSHTKLQAWVNPYMCDFTAAYSASP